VPRRQIVDTSDSVLDDGTEAQMGADRKAGYLADHAPTNEADDLFDEATSGPFKRSRR
jgi:hypothetical protein